MFHLIIEAVGLLIGILGLIPLLKESPKRVLLWSMMVGLLVTGAYVANETYENQEKEKEHRRHIDLIKKMIMGPACEQGKLNFEEIMQHLNYGVPFADANQALDEMVQEEQRFSFNIRRIPSPDVHGVEIPIRWYSLMNHDSVCGTRIDSSNPK